MTAATVETQAYVQEYSQGYSSGMVKRVLVGVGDFRLLLRKWFTAADQGRHTVVSRSGKVNGAYVPYEWYTRATAALGELDESGQVAMTPYVPDPPASKPAS